ncbi:TetR/AcrR family transcriptional regulator [Streptomyces capillispiralis]|uniref:TetR family transcriptional regulator n=1 Tax=Streptomyces capillispiralis TaxID=68182 RepID=A0A561TEK8_9ACTN|nr:TetR/AcrR family transcriptional regulator [Streptomyces capillispiralis]TWF85550.1 TetR family transcriptional regulator [Streptomyces capillispiralis]
MKAARSPLMPAGPARPGLRERKKTKTREAIREATFALIGERGYDAVTIERIAERAEVSPSTVLRYFPAKEDIVLTDAYDRPLLSALAERPADEPWPASVRHALHRAVGLALAEQPETTLLRARLLLEVPAVRSRMLESLSATGRVLARDLAARTGLDPDGLEVRVRATSLLCGLLEAATYWAEHGRADDLPGLVDRTLDILGHGLPEPSPTRPADHAP